jgi:hypothetical protein
MRSRDARGNSGGGVDVSTGGKGASLAGGGGAGRAGLWAGAFCAPGAFGFVTPPSAFFEVGLPCCAGADGFVTEAGGVADCASINGAAVRAGAFRTGWARAGVASSMAQKLASIAAAIMARGEHTPAATIFSFLPRAERTPVYTEAARQSRKLDKRVISLLEKRRRQ